ncbi:UNC93-like protein [Penaeus monodon]|uniref:UNC93-like protein n=1 Tax=Penaeus monodon TaxID=6687 RepID=UPI0018A75C75|nr:UNC93-like protein [Penaeus monodon]
MGPLCFIMINDALLDTEHPWKYVDDSTVAAANDNSYPDHSACSTNPTPKPILTLDNHQAAPCQHRLSKAFQHGRYQHLYFKLLDFKFNICYLYLLVLCLINQFPVPFCISDIFKHHIFFRPLVLSVGVEKNKTAEELLTCGYNFCLDQQYEDSPSNATVTTDSREDGPALWKIYTMASIYLACALLAAAITVFFVDPLSRFLKESPASQEKSGLVLVAATFNQLRHPYQLLIIPLTIWSGVEQAFLGADYTAAFVSCGLGVHMVGYVTICYGVCDAICSVGFSPIVRKYGRVPVFSLGFLINLGLNITLTYWTPKPDDLVVFFVISGLWGVADAVWQTQINTLYGVIFPGESEAAFSNYRLWESTGFIIAYACSTVLCVSSKIVVLNVFLLLGIVGYYAIEVLEKRGGLEKDKDGKVVVLDRLLLRLLKKRRASV